MGRQIRTLTPGTLWFVTTRCTGARYLLRPDRQLTALAGFHLARAARRFQGISIRGVMFMSNHLHLIVHDQESELSAFMERFLGAFAKAVNELRGRSGHVFERRFSAEAIVDNDAAVERLVYLTLNPVKAGLVDRHDEWPGLCLRAEAGNPVEHRFVRFNEAKFEAARE